MKWFSYSRSAFYIEVKARDQYEAVLIMRGLLSDPNVRAEEVKPCLKEDEEGAIS